MTGHRISELARLTGFTPSTLRYYEQVGLLRPQRSAAGYRLYGDAAVARLRFIARAKRLGLPLDDIRELVGVWDEGTCASVKTRLSGFVVAKSAEVRQQVAGLTEFARELGRAHDALGRPSPDGPCDDSCGCADAPTGSIPITCTLDVGEQTGRMDDWTALLALAVSRTPIAGGIRLTFPSRAGLAGEVAELAALEQQCCSFFTFTLEITADAVILDVRAPDEAAGLVGSLFGGPADQGVACGRPYLPPLPSCSLT
jgi:DNA-binding transcriptional MerR regulator